MKQRTAQRHAQLSDVISEHPHICYIAQTHGKKLEIAIYRGNKERALAVVEEAFRLREDCIDCELDRSVRGIFSRRIVRFLELANIKTLGQLCQKTRKELSLCDDATPELVDKIEWDLAGHGLSFRTDF